MSIWKIYSNLEIIIVTPSWPSRPRIQDISTYKVLFFQKADGQNGIRPSAFIRVFRLSAFFLPISLVQL